MVGYNQHTPSYGPGSSQSKQLSNSQVTLPLRSQNIIGTSQQREVVSDRGSRNIEYNNFEMQNKPSTPNNSFTPSQHQAAYSSNNNGTTQTAYSNNSSNSNSAQTAYSSSSSTEANKLGYNQQVSANAHPSGGITRFTAHSQYEPSYGVDSKAGSNTGPTSVSAGSSTAELLQSLTSVLRSGMISGGLNQSMRHNEPYNPAASAAGSSAYSTVTSSSLHATVGGQAQGAVAQQYGGATAHYDMPQNQIRNQSSQHAQHVLNPTDVDKREYYFDDHNIASSSRLGSSASAKPIRAGNTQLEVESGYPGDPGSGYRATAARAQNFPSILANLSAAVSSAPQGQSDYKPTLDTHMHGSHAGSSTSYDPSTAQQPLHPHVSLGYTSQPQPRKEVGLTRGLGADSAAYYQQKDYSYQPQSGSYSDNSNSSFSTSGITRGVTNSESYAPAMSMPNVPSQHSVTSHTAGLDSGYSSHIASSSRINSAIGILPGASNSQFEGYSINEKSNRGQLQLPDMGNQATKSRFQESMESSVRSSQNPLPYSNRGGYPVPQVQHSSDEYGASDLLARASGASSHIVNAPRGDYYPSTASALAGSTAVAPGAASTAPFIPGDVRYRRQNSVVTQPTTALPGKLIIFYLFII